MKNALRSSLLASFAVAVIADSADAKTPTIVYSSSGSCIASPFGFTAKLQPAGRRRDRNADNKINKLNIKQMFAGQTHGPFSTFY